MRWLLTCLVLGMIGFADVQADDGIPMRFSEGLLWVDIHVPGEEKPLQFVVDTGAEVSVINANTARILGLKSGRAVSVSGVHSSVTGRWLSKWRGEVAGISMPERCLVLDLSRLASACSNRVDGLVGADFFRNRIVQLDYKNQCLRILDRQTTRDTSSGIPLEIGARGMTIKVRVDNSKAASVRVDTGCASALEWVAKTPNLKATSTRVAVGLSTVSIPLAIAQVVIGSHSIDGLEIGLHARPIFPGESGLIGNGVFSRFDSITLDAVHNRLFFGAPID